MSRHSNTCGRLILTAVVLSVCAGGVSAAPNDNSNEEKTFPPFSGFSAAAQNYFDKLPKHRKGDIISQRDAKAVFRILKEMDWEVSDRGKILKLVLADGNYMVVQLRSKPGRVFMRDLSKTPAAYDRLERFLRLPKSKRYFQGLLKGPDGYKMFQYMVSSKGGSALGQQLSRTKNGRDFNKPTGRLYTAEEFIKRLSESHAAHLLSLKNQETNPQPVGN